MDQRGQRYSATTSMTWAARRTNCGGAAWLDVESNRFNSCDTAAGWTGAGAIVLRNVDQSTITGNTAAMPAKIVMIDCTEKVKVADNGPLTSVIASLAGVDRGFISGRFSWRAFLTARRRRDERKMSYTDGRSSGRGFCPGAGPGGRDRNGCLSWYTGSAGAGLDPGGGGRRLGWRACSKGKERVRWAREAVSRPTLPRRGAVGSWWLAERWGIAAIAEGHRDLGVDLAGSWRRSGWWQRRLWSAPR